MVKLAGGSILQPQEPAREKAVLRGFAIVAFCMALLAGLDQALNDGVYSRPAREMLSQIARSFGF
jgi:hypothetical protein